MGMEKMGVPSPEEQSEIEKVRTQVDVNIIKGGAEFKEDGRIEITEKQMEAAKKEMQGAINPEIKNLEELKQKAQEAGVKPEDIKALEDKLEQAGGKIKKESEDNKREQIIFENARIAAEKKLGELELKRDENTRKYDELSREESFAASFISRLLVVPTVGFSMVISEILSNRKYNKMVEENRKKDREIRDEITLQQIKADDPKEYEFLMKKEKVYSGQATKDEISDFNAKYPTFRGLKSLNPGASDRAIYGAL